MKKSRISRPVKYLYLFMVCVILFSMATTLASASNYTDTRHQDQGYLTNGSQTYYREKQDSTSCYVYNDNSSCAVAVYVYGAYNANGLGETNDSCYSYGIAVPVNGKKSICNMVHERGRTYASLKFWTSDSSEYEYIDLLWSPDSLGTYN